MHRQTDGQTEWRTYRGTGRQTISLAFRETLLFRGTLISAASFVIESNPCSDAPCTKVPQSCFIKLTHQFHETTQPPPPPSLFPHHTHIQSNTHVIPLHCRVHFNAFNETRQKASCEKLPTRQKFNWNWKCARLCNVLAREAASGRGGKGEESVGGSWVLYGVSLLFLLVDSESVALRQWMFVVAYRSVASQRQRNFG